MAILPQPQVPRSPIDAAMSAAVAWAATLASSLGSSTTIVERCAVFCLTYRGFERLLVQDVVSGDGQLDGKQVIGRAGRHSHGPAQLFLITDPHLGGQATSRRPGYRKPGYAVFATGIEHEAGYAMGQTGIVP